MFLEQISTCTYSNIIKITMQFTEIIRRLLRYSLGILSSTHGIETSKQDEVTVSEKIKNKLSSNDGLLFERLHNDLKDGVKAE